MEEHHIHGTKMSFHDDAKHTADFLKEGMHRGGIEGYLTRARQNGRAEFLDHQGKKFVIEHEQGEDGKDQFSVRKSQHQ